MLKGALILTLCGLSLVECGLSLAGVKCGVKSCKLNEYCSEFDRTCQPCSTICNDSSHNYDRSLCEKECQDFIHDNLYVRKDSVGGTGNDDLRGTVERLSRIVTGTLIIVCLMLIVLFCFLCFQFYRWKDKKNITFASLKNKIFGKKASTTVSVSKILFTRN
nr:protein grindelwald [Leptinotarsa decemlineata]